MVFTSDLLPTKSEGASRLRPTFVLPTNSFLRIFLAKSIGTIKVTSPTYFSKKKNLTRLSITKSLGHIVPIQSSWHLAVSVENRLPTTEKS